MANYRIVSKDKVMKLMMGGRTLKTFFHAEEEIEGVWTEVIGTHAESARDAETLLRRELGYREKVAEGPKTVKEFRI